MKKLKLALLFYFGLFLIASGQAKFEDFVNQFPLISGNFTLTGEDLEKARTSGKKIQGSQLFYITDGQKALGEYFPVGRVDISGTIFVFWAYHTGTYDEENTQIHLCSRPFNKKGNPVDLTQNYMASSGGVKNRFQYSFQAIFDSNKKTLFIEEKSTDKPEGTRIIYTLSKKGYGVKNVD